MNKKFLALIITIAALQPGTSSCMFYRMEIKELNEQSNQEKSNPDEEGLGLIKELNQEKPNLKENEENELILIKESKPKKSNPKNKNEKKLTLIKELSPAESKIFEKKSNLFEDNSVEDIEEKFLAFALRIFNLSNSGTGKKINKNEFDEISKLFQAINSKHTKSIEKIKKHYKIFTDFFNETMANQETANLMSAILNNKIVIKAINYKGEVLSNFLRTALSIQKPNLIKPLIELGAKADEEMLEKIISWNKYKTYHSNMFFDFGCVGTEKVTTEAIIDTAKLIVNNIDLDKIKLEEKSIGKICMSLAEKCIEQEQSNNTYLYKELAKIFMGAAFRNDSSARFTDWLDKNLKQKSSNFKAIFLDMIETIVNKIDHDEIKNNKNRGKIFLFLAKYFLTQINSRKHDEDKKKKTKILFQAALRNNIDSAKIEGLIRKNLCFNEFCSDRGKNHWNFEIIGYKNNFKDLANTLSNCDGEIITTGAARLLLEKNDDVKKDNEQNNDQNQPKKILPPCTTIGKVFYTTKNSKSSDTIVRPDVKIFLADQNQE